MCDPATLTIASTVVSAASTAAGFIGQSQAASAQEAANAANRQRMLDSQAYEYRVTGRREQQEDAAAGQRVQQLGQMALSDQSTAALSAQEAGLGGISVAGLLADIGGQYGSAISDTRTNLEATLQDLQVQQMGGRARTETAINGLPQVQRPSLLGAALKIGGGVVEQAAPYLGSSYDPFTPIQISKKG